MTVQEATFFLLNKLRSLYNESESSQITDWVMESLTGSKKAERMVYKNEALTDEEGTRLQNITERLLNHESIQYVLNESWFCGLKLYVDKNVLIPRPETEELVEWVISNCKFPVDELKILDIGTGSGCIAIALKRRLRKAAVWACDISAAAIEVAAKNAAGIGTEINFVQTDILQPEYWGQFGLFDIIVSNPPYVPQKDKANMQKNVMDHEPHQALFVPDNDALVFYRAIAAFGNSQLTPDGKIFCEINENMGADVQKLFQEKGYSTEIKKDLQGKNRMIKVESLGFKV